MSQKRTGDQTRELIFQACGNILRTEGAKRLTLEAVAREAGLSKGGLLYHFPNKRELIKELFKYHAEKFDADLLRISQEEIAKNGGWVRAYARASVEQIINRDNAGLLASLYAAGEEFPWVYETMRQRYHGWQKQIENCGLDPALATLVRLTIDGLWFSEMYQYAPPEADRRKQIVDLIFKLMDQDTSSLI